MINPNLNKLSDQYLFSQISKTIKSKQNVINLSVGDVSLPLPIKVIEAGKTAVDKLKDKKTFKGYPPETGYDFFKQAVKSYYNRINVDVDENEIFVSDGIKSDMGLFFNVLDKGKVLLPCPSYPAYIEASTIRGNEVVFYSELPDKTDADIIIICSPNNPTGKAMDKDELSGWVKLARKSGALILYDAAYEAYITSNAPKSIFEIDGANECAVEFCSLSKTAGFTGLRCGYTIVPKKCGLNESWRRAKSCLTNGVSFVTQEMACCALTDALPDIKANIKYYMKNAEIFVSALKGAYFTGGVDSPYIWLKVGDSYKEFYKLLDTYGLGVTPGAGFGNGGEQFIRINSFCSRQDALIAATQLKEYLFCPR